MRIAENMLAFSVMLLIQAIISGYVLVSAFLRTANLNNSGVLKLALGAGLGFGLTSCWLFIVVSLLHLDVALAFSIQTIVSTVALVLVLRRPGAATPAADGTTPIIETVYNAAGYNATLATQLFRFALVIAVLGNLLVFTHQCIVRPHGDYDAIMDWNLKARFLVDFNFDLKRSLPLELFWSHPEYPLLLPLLISAAWKVGNNTNLIVPHLVAAVYAAATIALLWATLNCLKGRLQADLGALLAMSSPFFVLMGTMLIADSPIGFYFLSTTACVFLSQKFPERRLPLLGLAGISAGLSAWTKREGLLFIAVLVVVKIILEYRSRKRLLHEIFFFMIGALPALACFAMLKIIWPASSDWANLYFDVAKFWNFAIYPQIIVLYILQFFAFGGWQVTPIPLLLLYFIAYKADRKDRQIRPSLLFFGVFLLLNLAYVAIFVQHADNAVFQIAVDAHRLQMQLWPSVLLLVLSNCKTPDEILSLSTNASK